jgi:hypothetical protein
MSINKAMVELGVTCVENAGSNPAQISLLNKSSPEFLKESTVKKKFHVRRKGRQSAIVSQFPH